MQGPSIHVEDLSLNLGNQQILAPMSFNLDAGKIHCLIGPNGGGKTSTLKCLLGQMPHNGIIRIDWPEKRVTGYVPQLIELDKTLPLTLENFLTLASQDRPAFTGNKKSIMPLIDSALDKTGLGDKRRFLLGSLSGGERQRLLFAQAMIPAPSLLVLDEPMTSMDETGIRMAEQLIRDFRDEGVTVLWVNHDLKQVEHMADSVTIIDHGLIVSGETREVLTPQVKQGAFKTLQEGIA